MLTIIKLHAEVYMNNISVRQVINKKQDIVTREGQLYEYPITKLINRCCPG